MPPTPVLIVTGVAGAPMAAATLSLQWDLPRAVVVRHHIDVAAQRLDRIISDASGTVERTAVDLDHTCVHCAIREEVVPTLRRVAADGRWGSVIAHLPVGAEATQVCRSLASLRPPDRVRVTAVVAALEGPRVVEDLLGDDLLRERGLQSSSEDHRGVGEVGAALVEYADLVALDGAADERAVALVTSLARPGAAVVTPSEVDARALVASGRPDQEADAWVAYVRRGTHDPRGHQGPAWSLDLHSHLPLHPGRLREEIQELGGGPHRSRGCFWLPSRPQEILGWSGAGGELGIGSVGSWGRSRPLTRLTVTGLDDGAPGIRSAFGRCLLTGAEAAERGTVWEVFEDGLEAWLGPIHHVA